MKTLDEVVARFNGLQAKHHPMSAAMEADCRECIHAAYRCGVAARAEDTDEPDDDERQQVRRPINVRSLFTRVGETRAVSTLEKNMRAMDCPPAIANRAARAAVAREMRAETNAAIDKSNRDRAAAIKL